MRLLRPVLLAAALLLAPGCVVHAHSGGYAGGHGYGGYGYGGHGYGYRPAPPPRPYYYAPRPHYYAPPRPRWHRPPYHHRHGHWGWR